MAKSVNPLCAIEVKKPKLPEELPATLMPEIFGDLQELDVSWGNVDEKLKELKSQPFKPIKLA